MTGRSRAFDRALRVPAWIVGVLVACHALGWLLVAARLAGSTLYVPPVQAAVALALSVVAVRAAALARAPRRTVAVCALAGMAVAFATIQMPPRFADNVLMVDGVERVESRARFETRFPLHLGEVNFHSHLGDVAIGALDRYFGAGPTSQERAYNALSLLAGFVFLAELLAVGALYRWSRRACRYIGLALGVPMATVFFGYWELGHMATAVGVVPLLLYRSQRDGVASRSCTMAAGAVQGLHTALHGFGILGMAGGALLALRTTTVSRALMRSLSFTSMAVALYLGWLFFYVMQFDWSLIYVKSLDARPWLTSAAVAGRLAPPLLSLNGLADMSIIGLLAGVPLLALALVRNSSDARTIVGLFALPGLLFLLRWAPAIFPRNWDLITVVVPGVWAALWVIAGSRARTSAGVVVCVIGHVLLWSSAGNLWFMREWMDGG